MNKLTKNYIYNSLYQLMAIVIPLITTPYLTRCLGKTALGIDSYVLSIVQLAQILGTLGTNLYANREIAYVRDNTKKLASTFLEIFLLRVFLLIVVLFIYFTIALNSNYTVVFLIQAVTLTSYFLDISWFFIGIEEMKPVVIRNTFVRLTVTVFIFAFIKKPSDLYLYVIISALGQFAGTALMFFQCRKIISFKNHLPLNIKRHIKPVFILFLPQAASSLYVLFDKTMLGLLATDISCVSIYDKAESLVKTPLIFATAMTSVIMPRIANEFVNNHIAQMKQLILNSLNFTFTLFLPICVGVAIIAPSFVPWYLGSQYTDSIIIVQMLCPIIMAIALSNVTGSQYLVASGSSKYLTISYVIGATFNLIGNYLLIPIFNEKGATFTTIIAEFLVLFIQLYATRKGLGGLNIFYLLRKKIWALIAMIVFIVPLNKLGYSIYTAIFQIITGCIIYFIVLMLLKDKGIYDIITSIKKRLPKGVRK